MRVGKGPNQNLYYSCVLRRASKDLLDTSLSDTAVGVRVGECGCGSVLPGCVPGYRLILTNFSPCNCTLGYVEKQRGASLHDELNLGKTIVAFGYHNGWLTAWQWNQTWCSKYGAGSLPSFSALKSSLKVLTWKEFNSLPSSSLLITYHAGVGERCVKRILLSFPPHTPQSWF